MMLATEAALPEDDALDLTLRLVLHLFGKVFEADATATWTAPGAVILLGGRKGAPALALPTRWGAKVAGRPRDDGVVRISCVHRLNDAFQLDLRTGEATTPSWAGGLVQRAQGMLDASSGGASLLGFLDVPDQSGIGAGAALDCALAMALAGAAGSPLAPEELLAGMGAAADASTCASLLGRPGFAIMTGDGEPAQARFDPAQAGLRLVVVSTRPRSPGSPTPEWRDQPHVPDVAAAGFDAVCREDWQALGRLLTTSHLTARSQQEPDDADLIVETLLGTGALGARATSPATAVALVATRSVRETRMEVSQAFRVRNLPVPRFLTTGALPPATARPSDPLEV